MTSHETSGHALSRLSDNCDLHIRVLSDGVKCNPITVEGFAFMWAGVRANYGIASGRVCYECKARLASELQSRISQLLQLVCFYRC